MPPRLSIVQFFALLCTSISLVPLGAHLAELPHKMRLAADQYMIVQQIYAGWSWFGIAFVLALIFSAWHIWLLRNRGIAFYWATAAFLCIAAAQGIFWAFTFPMNALTANWTQVPATFAQARWQWEISHSAAALVVLSAFAMQVFAVLASRPLIEKVAAGSRNYPSPLEAGRA